MKNKVHARLMCCEVVTKREVRHTAQYYKPYIECKICGRKKQAQTTIQCYE